MDSRSNFIYQNEAFTCAHCGHENPLSTKKIRNHCQKCLYSLHVDDQVPGDRASHCQKLMAPVYTYQTGNKGWMVMHECLQCQKQMPNQIIPEDDWDTVIKLAKPYYE